MRISDWSSDVCSSDLGNASSVAASTPGTPLSLAAAAVRSPAAVEQDLPPALLMQRPSAHIATQGRTAIRIGAMPTTTSQLQFSRSEEHTSELQSLMRISYAVFCLKKKKKKTKKI